MMPIVSALGHMPECAHYTVHVQVASNVGRWIVLDIVGTVKHDRHLLVSHVRN